MIKKWSEYIKENDSEVTLDIDAIEDRMEDLQNEFDNAGHNSASMEYSIECEDDVCVMDVSVVYDECYYLYTANFSDLTLEKHIMKKGPGQPQDQHKKDIKTFKDVPLMVGVSQILEEIEDEVLGLVNIEHTESDMVQEARRGQWDSSIKEDDAREMAEKVVRFHSKVTPDKIDFKVVKGLESRLQNYDLINQGFVVETVIYGGDDIEEIIEGIIDMGDKIMNAEGTEPRQVINAFEDAFSYLETTLNIEIDEDDTISEMAPDLNERKFIKRF